MQKREGIEIKSFYESFIRGVRSSAAALFTDLPFQLASKDDAKQQQRTGVGGAPAKLNAPVLTP